MPHAPLTARSYRGVVVRVIDGDTVEVRLDLGFDVWRTSRLRVRGLDCPERNTGAGVAALAHAMYLLPPGSVVTTTTYRRQQADVKTFDRYVADVCLSDGRDFAESMIAVGKGARRVGPAAGAGSGDTLDPST